jgi:hypothetical protein
MLPIALYPRHRTQTQVTDMIYTGEQKNMPPVARETQVTDMIYTGEQKNMPL